MVLIASVPGYCLSFTLNGSITGALIYEYLLIYMMLRCKF